MRAETPLQGLSETGEPLPVGASTDAQRIMSHAATENFPVASRLFPRALRPHLLAIYGFARLVDDIGDEAPGDRLGLLAAVSAQLDTIYAGGMPSHLLLRRLAHTVRRFDIPRSPLDRLVQANEQDQVVGRYETFADLLGYCRLSAQPVGELVLRVAELCTPERLVLSDRVCSGLQLVELWQDIGEDAAMGRIYVPAEDMRRFGYSDDDLLTGVVDDRFRRLMTFEATRTRELLESGRALHRTIPGRLGFAIRLYAAGGLAALDDLRQRGYATFDSSAHAGRGRRWLATARELPRT